MKGAPKITLCVIARDEERDLGECLKSTRAAVDEVVVVDTGSQDKTKEVARSLGAKVVDFAWQDDFAAARNVALEHATGDWILVLDCDERLTPGGAIAIREAVRETKAVAYRLEVVSEVGQDQPQRVWLVRLYRRHPAIRYVRRIHETVNEAIVEVGRREGKQVFDLPVVIQHWGYVPKRFLLLHKRERNLRLHKLTVDDRPDDAYAWYRYGDELRAVDRAEAARALEKSWQLLVKMTREERKAQIYAPEVPALRAMLALEDAGAEAALALIDEGAPLVGYTPNLHYVRALVLERKGDARSALEEYRWLLGFHGKRTEAPMQPGLTTSIARLGCARMLEALGDLAGVETALREAATIDPKHSKTARELARILAAQGRGADARGEIEAYLKRAPHDGEAWALAGKLAFEAGYPEAALQRYRIAASAFDAPAWVLRELAIVQACCNDLAGALRTVERITDPQERKKLESDLEARAKPKAG